MSEGRRELAWGFLGRIPYREAVELQESLRDDLIAGRGGEALLLLEHPHVYTLGRSARRGDLVASAGWLAERGVEVAESDRGGQITYHGPGQLVGYPIVNLDPDRRDVRRYVADLSRALAATARRYGIEARGATEERPIGLWVGERKLASIGVHLKRWRTTHGFALNVTTDLSYFAGIVPCGLPEVELCSIESLSGRRPDLPEVARAAAESFAEVFDRRLVPFARHPRLESWASAS